MRTSGRHATLLKTLAAAALSTALAFGCGRAEPSADATPSAAVPPQTTPQASADAASATPPPAESDAGAPSTEEADAGHVAEAPPPAAPPQVGEEECKAACDNALTITMRELPPDAKPEMRAEVERVLREDCPKRCREVGTKASVECITRARSAYDLVACPK